MEKTHIEPLGGHFAVNKLYKALATHWYWEKMYKTFVRIVPSVRQYRDVAARINQRYTPHLYSIH